MKTLFDYYNLGAIEEIPGIGDGLVRIPKKVRNSLNDRARFIGMDSVGIEARFVTESPNIDLFISALKPEFGIRGSVRIFKGNFQCYTLEIELGKVNFFRINPPSAFENVNENLLCQGGYSPNVWRIVFDTTTFVLHGINTQGYDIRKPTPNELPSLSWLAYGSSITNSNLDGYPHVAAAALKVQVQNMGMSGACQIEKELVDYMLDERQFDFITCELGVNMQGVYTPQEFEERAAYLINRLVHLQKPAMIITSFPNYTTSEFSRNNSLPTQHDNAYNAILVKLVQSADCKTLKLVQGRDILTDTNGLSSDLTHPTTYGHAVMGANLAVKLNGFLTLCGLPI